MWEQHLPLIIRQSHRIRLSKNHPSIKLWVHLTSSKVVHHRPNSQSHPKISSPLLVSNRTKTSRHPVNSYPPSKNSQYLIIRLSHHNFTLPRLIVSLSLFHTPHRILNSSLRILHSSLNKLPPSISIPNTNNINQPPQQIISHNFNQPNK